MYDAEVQYEATGGAQQQRQQQQQQQALVLYAVPDHGDAAGAPRPLVVTRERAATAWSRPDRPQLGGASAEVVQYEAPGAGANATAAVSAQQLPLYAVTDGGDAALAPRPRIVTRERPATIFCDDDDDVDQMLYGGGEEEDGGKSNTFKTQPRSMQQPGQGGRLIPSILGLVA